MTNLTEKWKNGCLKPGHYYCKSRNGHVSVYQILKVNEKLMHNKSGEIKEVLAPCDYEELVYLHKARNDAHEIVESLTKENQQLKDLLKECRDVIKDVDTYCTKNADEGYILIYRIDNAIGEKK